jgi:hypothetical protein
MVLATNVSYQRIFVADGKRRAAHALAPDEPWQTVFVHAAIADSFKKAAGTGEREDATDAESFQIAEARFT